MHLLFKMKKINFSLQYILFSLFSVLQITERRKLILKLCSPLLTFPADLPPPDLTSLLLAQLLSLVLSCLPTLHSAMFNSHASSQAVLSVNKSFFLFFLKKRPKKSGMLKISNIWTSTPVV